MSQMSARWINERYRTKERHQGTYVSGLATFEVRFSGPWAPSSVVSQW